MNELAQPFVRLWNYIGNYGGYAGQMFFIVTIVTVFALLGAWLSNRR